MRRVFLRDQTAGKTTPPDHEDDDQAEDQQRSMISQNIADLGYHRKLIELAAGPGVIVSTPAYAYEHVRPSSWGRTTWIDGLPLAREAVTVSGDSHAVRYRFIRCL